jgi:hypothetical protein
LLWKKTRKTTAQAAADTHALHQVQRTVEKLRRRIVGGSMPAQNVPQSNVALIQCKTTAFYGNNYFQVKKFDNNTVSGAPFYVAKDMNGRIFDKANEIIDTVLISYTYPAGTDAAGVPNKENNRTASDGSNSEAQVVYPRYCLAQSNTTNKNWDLGIVWVIEADHTGVYDNTNTEVKYLEIKPARVWARRYVQ